MPALNYFQTAEALRKEREGYSIRQMAERWGTSEAAMRRRLCDHGVRLAPDFRERHRLYCKLWRRGTDQEIAEFMDMHLWKFLKWKRKNGYHLVDSRGQFAMWKVVRLPRLQVVHIAQAVIEIPDIQLSLFDPSNTRVINAADRFIAETSGNDLVQLHAAAQ